MDKLSLALAVAVITVGLSGCGGEIVPVRNIDKAPVLVSAKSYTDEQVRNAIIVAGKKLKWDMVSKAPGIISGSIYSKGTEAGAEIEVVYSKSTYSIMYVSSKGLMYDNGKIDNRYNRWMQNLTKEIDLTLVQTVR